MIGGACFVLVAAITVVGPATRTDPLHREKHSALQKDHVFLVKRYGGHNARPPPVAAVPTKGGGAFLIVAPGPDARLYRIDRRNQVVWWKDFLFEDIGAFVTTAGPGDGFTIVWRAQENRIYRYRVRAYDAEGVPRWTTELPPEAGEHALLARWGERGLLLAYAVRRLKSQEIRAHLITGAGGRPWGENGVSVHPQASFLRFSMIHDGHDSFVFVWQDHNEWSGNPPGYFAQRLSAEGTIVWEQAVSLGSAARYSMVRVGAGPPLSVTRGGVRAHLMGGYFSDIGHKSEPYIATISPDGMVTHSVFEPESDPEIEKPARLPFFRDLPRKKSWARLGQVERTLLGSPCAFARVKRGFVPVPDRPNVPALRGCNGLLPFAVLPPTGGEAIELRVTGRRSVFVRHKEAVGVALPEGPSVGYATKSGASYWLNTPSGLHTWVLYDDVGAADGLAEWRVASPHRVRGRQGAVEIIDTKGKVVVTVTVTGRRAPRPWAARAASSSTAAPELRVHGRAFGLDLGERKGQGLGAYRISWVSGSAPALGPGLAMRLPGGRVLVVEGRGSRPSRGVVETEVLDVARRRWTQGPSLEADALLAAAPLSGGRHLVVASSSATTPRRQPELSAWILEPAPLRWRRVASPPRVPGSPRMVSLDTDHVVLSGTHDRVPLVYDSSADAWSGIEGWELPGSVGIAPLPEGRVLFAGGRIEREMVATTVIYEVKTRLWTLAPPMPIGRYEHQMVHLGAGRVLVFGGRVEKYVRQKPFVFDSDSNRWEPVARPNPVNGFPKQLVTLASGLLVWTGNRVGEAPALGMFDPSAESWTSSAPLDARQAPRLVPLEDGRLLVVGGTYLDRFPIPVVYDPERDEWSRFVAK